MTDDVNILDTNHRSMVFKSSDRNDFKKLVKKCIQVEYENLVMSGSEGKERLLSALENIPSSDFMVFHRSSNLHLSFFDYLDGSKFDIFVLDDKTILIIPFKNSSESSFNNMLEGIHSELGEGAVDEYVFQDYSLEDIEA